MARFKRKNSLKPKTDNGRYRSGLEKRIWSGPLKGVPYESKSFPYIAIEERKYTPDGILSDTVWIEVKGRFRTRSEAKKYLHIKKCYPLVYIIFILGGKNVPLPGAKERKRDGRKRTHEDWLSENGFLYCYEGGVEEFLRDKYPELMNDLNIPSIKEIKWRKKMVK